MRGYISSAHKYNSSTIENENEKNTKRFEECILFSVFPQQFSSMEEFECNFATTSQLI